MVSPVSPSPAVKAALVQSSPAPLLNSPSAQPVVVYEDAPSPEKAPGAPVTVSQSTQALSQQDQALPAIPQDSLGSSQDFSDHDEENDPIIHSFGPFGQNLNSRMASFTAGESPRLGTPPRSFRLEPLRPTVSPSQPTSFSDKFDITGHVINQLAFSRLSSTPLSTILSHLPEEAGAISKDDLTTLINSIDCIGEVSREGKDAAGKKLESEYYYIPDKDKDEKRKEAVVNDLMKPGLRACRKQHKVCDSNLQNVTDDANISLAILLAQAEESIKTTQPNGVVLAIALALAIASTVITANGANFLPLFLSLFMSRRKTFPLNSTDHVLFQFPETRRGQKASGSAYQA
jgi:hypothetical protein